MDADDIADALVRAAAAAGPPEVSVELAHRVAATSCDEARQDGVQAA